MTPDVLLFVKKVGALEVRTSGVITGWNGFDERAWEHGFVGADVECDAWGSAAARERVQGFDGVVKRARNGGVVRVDDRLRHKDKSGPGVCDDADGNSAGTAGADGVTLDIKSPVALTAVDGHVGDISGEFGFVYKSKVATPRPSLFQVDGEERGRQVRVDVVQKRGFWNLAWKKC